MDDAEFSRLLAQHTALLRKVAWAYCPDVAGRDDVVQEIAAELWRCRHRFDPDRRATTWIYRVALNVAIGWWRRERRHQRRRAELDAAALAAVPPPEASEDLQRLQAALDGLPPLDRALVLLWLDGNDHETTGEVLGISPGNAATRLYRLKERLRRRLAAGSPEPPQDHHGTR